MRSGEIIMIKHTKIFYGWWIVFACIVGLAVSPAPIAFYSIGVLMQPLSEVYAWSPSEISLAATLFTIALILTTPLIGLMVDKVGPKKVLIPSMLGFALCLFALSFARSLSVFYIMYFFMGVICAGANSLAYMRLLSFWFDRKRGLVVGIASAGMGVGFAVVPILTQFLINQGGLFYAYSGLALLVLCTGLPAIGLIVKDTPEQCGLVADGLKVNEAISSRQDLDGISAMQAIKMPQFWIIVTIFILGSGTVYAIALHLVSIIRSIEVNSDVAIRAASLIGITMIVGRVLAGYTFDKVYAPWVTAAIFFSATIGTLLLATGLPGYWVIVASVLIGLCSGAEADALAILVGRYFGLLDYGKIYGHIFCAALIGASLFPYILGLGYEYFGSYMQVLYICTFLFSLSVIMAFFLGPPPTTFTQEN
jgi:MFS family permease